MYTPINTPTPSPQPNQACLFSFSISPLINALVHPSETPYLPSMCHSHLPPPSPRVPKDPRYSRSELHAAKQIVLDEEANCLRLFRAANNDCIRNNDSRWNNDSTWNKDSLHGTMNLYLLLLTVCNFFYSEHPSRTQSDSICTLMESYFKKAYYIRKQTETGIMV